MTNNVNTYPKITIVTPNLNGGRFLEKAICSIVGQNYPNLEYIVIDGASVDNSIKIIEKYSDKISYWISEKDDGMYDAIQKGFERSSGEIMGWLNSDDILHTNSLFHIAKIFQDNPNVEWIEGVNTLIDTNDLITNVHIPANRHLYYYLLMLQDSKSFRYIQQESTYWKRSLWEKSGASLNISLKYAGDYELWMRFFLFGEYYSLKSIIGGFRNSGENQLSKLNFNSYLKEVEQTNKWIFSRLTAHQKKEIHSLKFKFKLTSIFLKYKYFAKNILINKTLINKEIKLNETFQEIKSLTH